MAVDEAFTVETTWVQGLQFVGRAKTSRAAFVLDGATEFGGLESGVRPMEALLISLASCTGMDVISVLQKKRQQVTAFRVEAKGIRAAEHPRRYVRIELEFVVRGWDVAESAVARSIELSQEKYCGVTASLNCEVVSRYRIEQEQRPS
ncbi:MAG: OsmC family protein [Chloroflexi bacterium]|nr:OsmC family protein [Chloroflexota bacterium]